MLLPGARTVRPERNWLVRLTRRVLPVTDGYRGESFWVRESGKWNATPLFVALIAVETMDILFAVDSVPAVLAITRDSFIAYSSNVFAILGLRAMYFGLASILPRFRFLHPGLAAILIFVGTKMVIADRIPIPTGVSLGVLAGILSATVCTSMLWPRAQKK
jgi:tellurite resistance protein TerC